MLTTEEIVQLYEQRRRNQGPVQEQMRRVRDLANGDVIVPLNELDKNAKSSVANLLVQECQKRQVQQQEIRLLPIKRAAQVTWKKEKTLTTT